MAHTDPRIIEHFNSEEESSYSRVQNGPSSIPGLPLTHIQQNVLSDAQKVFDALSAGEGTEELRTWNSNDSPSSWVTFGARESIGIYLICEPFDHPSMGIRTTITRVMFPCNPFQH